MTRKAGYTAGRVEFIDGFLRAKGGPLKVVGVQIPCVVGPSRLEAIHNSMFIAEAFTVAHETGLTPRQLAERCKELEGVLAGARDYFIPRAKFVNGNPNIKNIEHILLDRVEDAIAKTGGAA